MGFETDLSVIKLAPDRWQITKDFIYRTHLDSHPIKVDVPAGFITDFASVPRWPVAYWLTGNTAHRAAVIHDWLYDHGAPSLEGPPWLITRKQADLIFLNAMKDSGVPGWRRWTMYTAVRAAGGRPWRRYRVWDRADA